MIKTLKEISILWCLFGMWHPFFTIQSIPSE